MTAPRIEHHGPRRLAGLGHFGDPMEEGTGWTEENAIGRLWERLSSWLSAPGGPYPWPTVFFEVHVETVGTPLRGEFEVFVGFEVGDDQQLPVDLSMKVLPEGDYAVFTLRGEQIRSDEPILDSWLAGAPFEKDSCFMAQRYDERFLGLERLAESELDFLVPVRPTVPGPSPARSRSEVPGAGPSARRST
ncbi:MAG: hypothetical protein QG608_2409 [Actinomycetota bacterium]|nr:hypothetical protein [Actinomycetota bacterium]